MSLKKCIPSNLIFDMLISRGEIPQLLHSTLAAWQLVKCVNRDHTSFCLYLWFGALKPCLHETLLTGISQVGSLLAWQMLACFFGPRHCTPTGQVVCSWSHWKNMPDGLASTTSAWLPWSGSSCLSRVRIVSHMKKNKPHKFANADSTCGLSSCLTGVNGYVLVTSFTPQSCQRQRHEERRLTETHSFIPILICVCLRVCVCENACGFSSYTSGYVSLCFV